uniref:Integrase catalytic domain-containing protein n=1 Tax=Globodera rostochiensis TaxID=31243 RepID=A0A914HAF5_GLORO
MKRARPSPEFPEIEFNVNTMGLTVYCPRHLKTPRLVPWDQPGRCSRCRSGTVELDYFIQAEGVTVFSTRLKNRGEHFVPFDEIVDFGDNAKIRIRSRNKVFTLPLRQPEIPELERQGIIVHAGAPSDEMLNKLPKPFLIVYDDLMGEIDAKKLADLYTKKSHHNNFAVIFLTQNLFDKAMRVPRRRYVHLLSRAGCEELLTLVEICLNILNGSFCLTTNKKQKITPFANFIRKVGSSENEKVAGIGFQSGGSLLPPYGTGLLRRGISRVTSRQQNWFVKQQFEKAKRKRRQRQRKSAEYIRSLMNIEVEVGPEPRPSRKRDLKKQEIMAKEQQLLSIIKSDPKRFGVNARDKIINPSTGREFIDFDLTRAIERLVNPRPENAPSPSDVQADLADFQALSRKNSGNRYLLLAVDVLSRRMFGAPVKSKKPADMKRAFEELFGQMPKLPETLYTDRGLEFVAKPLKEFYAEKGIQKFETSSKKKAAVAERAIRTLKTRLYKFSSYTSRSNKPFELCDIPLNLGRWVKLRQLPRQLGVMNPIFINSVGKMVFIFFVQIVNIWGWVFALHKAHPSSPIRLQLLEKFELSQFKFLFLDLAGFSLLRLLG